MAPGIPLLEDALASQLQLGDVRDAVSSGQPEATSVRAFARSIRESSVMIAASTRSRPRAKNQRSPARGQSWTRADSLHRWRPPLLGQVVVERLLEDRWIDEADEVLERAQAGGIRIA
jgi:hypothetical protein